MGEFASEPAEPAQAEGEAWVPPSPEEWEAAQTQLAAYQELQAFEEWQAAGDEQEASMAELQARLLDGEPGALEAMQQGMAAMVDERMAPVREWQERVDTARRNELGERVLGEWIDGNLERLDAKGVV